jgi:hypothetical protein
MWRRDDGVYVAWLVLSRPGVLVRAMTVIGLREAIEQKTGKP